MGSKDSKIIKNIDRPLAAKHSAPDYNLNMTNYKRLALPTRLLLFSLLGILMNPSSNIFAEKIHDMDPFRLMDHSYLVNHYHITNGDSVDDLVVPYPHVLSFPKDRLPNYVWESTAIPIAPTCQNCEDVNSADAQTLQRVRGISLIKAQAIIDYRNEFGPFKSLDELTQVRGIGPATVENFRIANFCVNDSDSDTSIQPEELSTPSVNNSPDCLNINTASASSLQKVNRIGEVKAQSIIEYRTEVGTFQSLNDLTNVKGIGPSTVENFRSAGFCVEESTTNISTPDENQNDTPSTASESSDVNCTNVNTADASSLQRVNRVGSVKAQAIIEHRSEFGLFQSLDDLSRVKGIGPATIENFRKSGFCAHSSNGSVHNSDHDQTIPLTDSVTDTCENLNSVDVHTLQHVSGIGQIYSQSIIDERERSGQFDSMDEIGRIDGIESSTIETLLESGFCVATLTPPEDSMNDLTYESSLPPYPIPYDRSLYGGWLDTDDDCQNTRMELLLSKSLVTATLDETGCRVISGEWFDPYTGRTITDPQEIDIDHFIPLSEAHRSGAATWSEEKRHLFGNDLTPDGVLIPVLASTNRSKGSRGPDQWLPPNKSFHCQYANRWVNLKEIWFLTMDYQESKTLHELREKCTSETITP